jgi:chemotaxis protein methyltransferase CheR
MDLAIDYEIGIVEYRNIIKVIRETYDCDFSDYTLTSLKRRFEHIIQLHNIKHPDILIEKLRLEKSYVERFLFDISIESTEMFRDPSFWRYLRDEFFPTVLKDTYKPRIWFPKCVSGEELFTLEIVLKEQNLAENVEIIGTCVNDLCLQRIESGYFKPLKVEVSSDNYDRYQGKGHLKDYYSLHGEQVVRNTSLIKNVNFIKQNINFDNSPQDIKLIIFRNQLIYFTQSLQDRVLKIFYDSLMTGGYLILGAKEQVGSMSAKYFKLINEAESVYKKI